MLQLAFAHQKFTFYLLKENSFLNRIELLSVFLKVYLFLQVLSFTHPTSFHSAETYESLLQCLRMEDDKVAEAAIQIFRNTGHKIETDLPQIRS